MYSADRSVGLVPTDLVLHLPPDSASVSDARHAIRGFCESHSLGEVVDDAELLTSELMTNACRHTDGAIRVFATRQGPGILVMVTDDSQDQPVVSVDAPAADDDSGRGLFLVDRLSGDWGTTHFARDKTVWFRLP